MEIDLNHEPVTLTRADLRDLLEWNGGDIGPFVSIYIPATDRLHQADEGRIRFKNQLKEVARQLDAGDPRQGQASPPLLEALRRLSEESAFWRAHRHGFVVFASPERVRVWRVLQDMPEMAVVGDAFHVKPLLRIVPDAERFQVLCVSNERTALLEGDEHGLEQVPLHPDVPADMAEAIGEPARVAKTRRTRYDQGETDAHDDQLKRYFRRLDEGVWEHHSRRARLPLILAALPEYQGFFRQASHNLHLLEAGIERDPFALGQLDTDKLAELAGQLVRRDVGRRVAALRERFGAAQAHGKASDKLRELGPLAVNGRLATLAIERDAHCPGRLDPGTGEVVLERSDHPARDDVLDEIAEAALATDAELLVLNRTQMPSEAPIVGIQRY